MPKKSRQKFKYLEIFHHFLRAIIAANKKTFLEDESPTKTCKPYADFCQRSTIKWVINSPLAHILRSE